MLSDEIRCLTGHCILSVLRPVSYTHLDVYKRQAAIYAKRANLSAVVIEKEYEGTGQIAESGQVDNYPGFPGISGYDLDVYKRQAWMLQSSSGLSS